MTDSVLAPDDTVDAKVLLSVLAQVKGGDFTARMPLEWTGVAGQGRRRPQRRHHRQPGARDRAGPGQPRWSASRASSRSAWCSAARTQGWSGSVESVNSLIDDLVRPTIEMQRVIGAVADGDLSKKVSADVRGEMLELKNTINAMVDQLNGFISEVTRVAREVGTEGKLGQAAAVTIEVGGVWKDLTDNVNLMAGNLTGQVRNIAEVTTAVANGDLSKKISIDVKGEFLELKNTVNAMVDQLNAFASEVTRVAREVGVEGKLGGQAQSKEVGGVWKDLTDNVNQLAANLTNQVRAIAEVATAVTEGDLTRQVRVEASGEVAVLKDKLNEMIRNLRETTRQNIEQDWLKTNRERFTRMLQGQRDLADGVEHDPLRAGAAGVGPARRLLLDDEPADGGEPRARAAGRLRLRGAQAPLDVVPARRGPRRAVRQGEEADPADRGARRLRADQLRARRRRPPLNIIVLPVLFEGSVRAVVELASFSPFSATHQAFLDQLTESIGLVLSTIEADTLTENLLKQSQSQAEELRSQQEELRESNEDLGRQAALLAEQNIEAEQKNQEVEESKRLVEEKAGQLAVSSKYKSEFIANMSHELRTPLNSLLILAQQLEDNPDNNMTADAGRVRERHPLVGQRPAEPAQQHPRPGQGRVGHGHRRDGESPLAELCTGCCASSSTSPQGKGLGYSVDVAPDVPATHRHRPAAAAPDPQEPARQRVQVHRARRGAASRSAGRRRVEPETRVARDGAGGRGLRGQRHGHRHRRRAAAADLRGVRPGRRDARPGSTAARGSGCRSAASWSACSAARSP